MRYFLEKL